MEGPYIIDIVIISDRGIPKNPTRVSSFNFIAAIYHCSRVFFSFFSSRHLVEILKRPGL